MDDVEKLSVLEKALEQANRLNRQTADELLDEQKRNLYLAKQLLESYDRRDELAFDLRMYRIGFWALNAVCVGYLVFLFGF